MNAHKKLTDEQGRGNERLLLEKTEARDPHFFLVSVGDDIRARPEGSNRTQNER